MSTAERSSTIIQRAHLTFPVFDPANHTLVRNISVVLLDDTGQQVTDGLWSGPLPTDTGLGQPAVFPDGVVDVWMDSPGRYTVVCTNVGQQFSRTYTGVDAQVGADTQVLFDGDHWWQASGIKQQGYWLQAPSSGGSTALWVAPPLIGPHQHNGTQPGSTVLNGGTVVDGAIDQAWLGYQSGDAATVNDTTAVGSSIDPSGAGTVLVGSNSSANAAEVTVAGPTSTSSAQGDVLLGGDHTSTSAGVTGPNDSGGGTTLSSDPGLTTLRYGAKLSGSVVTVGSSVPVPTAPAGVSSPVWLLGLVTQVGGLRANGPVSLGGSASTLTVFGGPGSAKTTVDPGSSQGALLSLVSAMRNYGLC